MSLNKSGCASYYVPPEVERKKRKEINRERKNTQAHGNVSPKYD